MRMIYQRASDGCLHETIVPTPVRSDLALIPRSGTTALVVHPDPAMRQELHRQLTSDGFDVAVTCAGPGTVACPALVEPRGLPCPRCLPGVSRIVLDEGIASPALVSAYREWAPEAEIRIVSRRAAEPAFGGPVAAGPVGHR